VSQLVPVCTGHGVVVVVGGGASHATAWPDAVTNRHYVAAKRPGNEGGANEQ
jgi:hypothetical protein